MEELRLYRVEPEYLRLLHKYDSRVSVKFNSRPFVGIVVMLNGVDYLIPLTSQTTATRIAQGKGKRSARVTTFIKDSSGNEIANLLHNNMIPIVESVCTELVIDASLNADTYESNEIRFIRKNSLSIMRKARMVYQSRMEGKDSFMQRICCDFALLEAHYKEYKR